MATEPRLRPLTGMNAGNRSRGPLPALLRALAISLVAFAPLVVSCDSATDPSRTSSLPVAFSIDLAGGAAAAFDAADAIRIIVVADDVIVHEEVLPFSSEGGDVRIRLPVDSDLDGAALGVDVELRRGQDPLFSGSGTVTARSRATDPVDILLEPVIAAVVPQTGLLIPLIGGTLQLNAVAVFATGDTITTVPVAYQLLDQGIIRLQPGGVAVGDAEGTARVRATAGARSVDFVVEVRILAATVTVEPGSAIMGIGGTLRLLAQVFDGAGNPISRQPAWSSDDVSVATVTSLGVVTAVAAGSVVITATVDDAQGSAAIEVSTTPRPAAPTGLSAVSAGTTVNLTWQDNATNETSYEVQRGPAGGTVTSVATLPANSLEFSDTNLPADQVYDYVAAACNQQICSVSDRVMAYTRPTAPTGLTVLQNDPGTNIFRLGWTDASMAETEFRVERIDPTTGQFAPIATLPAGTTQYTGTGAPSSTETYRVAACNPAGCAVSGTVMLTFAAAPPLAITLPSTTGTEMNGTTDADGELHDWWFEYYYDETFVDAFSTSPKSTTAAGVKTENLFDLASGQVWYYRIVAENAAGIAYGNAEVLIAPILDNLGPSTANVCLLGSSCMVDPPTITFQASSVVPLFAPDPFQFVMFNIESPSFYSLPGSPSVTFFDDPDGYRIYTYSLTVDASMISGLNLGPHQAVARGYPASSSGNVITTPINFNVTAN